jgi:hypothetical protein
MFALLLSHLLELDADDINVSKAPNYTDHDAGIVSKTQSPRIYGEGKIEREKKGVRGA